MKRFNLFIFFCFLSIYLIIRDWQSVSSYRWYACNI